MRQCNLPHFPCCQTMSNQVDANMFPNIYYADKLNILCVEVTRDFGDFKSQQGNFELFRNPCRASNGADIIAL